MVNLRDEPVLYIRDEKTSNHIPYRTRECGAVTPSTPEDIQLRHVVTSLQVPDADVIDETEARMRRDCIELAARE